MGQRTSATFMKRQKADIYYVAIRSVFPDLVTHRDKFKAEQELLQNQGMITPVIEVTEWCAPIVVNLKKGNRQSAQMNKYMY